MARLPIPGSDQGTWGDVLNDYLGQSHTIDGTLKADSVGTSQLKLNAVTATAILDGSITTAKVASAGLAPAAISGTAIIETDLRLSDQRTPSDTSVTTAKLSDSSVSTIKLQDTAVTTAKLETSIQTSLSKANTALQAADITAKLDATVATSTYAARAKTVKTLGRFSNWGHSYAFGIGTSDESKRFSRIIAERYRLDHADESVSGTAFAGDSSGASFGKFLQVITRGTTGYVVGSGVAATAQAGFATPGGVHSLFYGINDVNSLGNTTAALEPVRQAFRTAISRLRAGAILESDTAPFAYSGTGWSTQATANASSGANYKMTTVNGDSYTITLPADFPGGTLALGIVALSGVGNGGIHTTTSFGVSRSIAAFSTRTGSATHFVWRLTGLPAGAQSIVVTVSGIVASTSIDYAQWEAPDAQAPLTILHLQPYPVNYSAYGSVAPGPPTNSGVDALNQIIRDVATEFGSRCLIVDHSNMNGVVAMFSATDSLHPSDLGHSTIAANTIAAIDAAGFVIETGLPIRPRYDYGAAAPTGTRTYYPQGSYVENTNPTELGAVSAKYFVNGWKCLVAGRPATWVEDRRFTGN